PRHHARAHRRGPAPGRPWRGGARALVAARRRRGGTGDRARARRPGRARGRAVRGSRGRARDPAVVACARGPRGCGGTRRGPPARGEGGRGRGRRGALCPVAGRRRARPVGLSPPHHSRRVPWDGPSGPRSAVPTSSTTDTLAVHRRTVRTMTVAQVFSAMGNGSTLALGSILAVDLSGRESLAGTTTTALTLAPALLAVPLSGIAVRHGRRFALASGLVVATAGTAAIVGATVWRSFALLILGAFLVGVGSAVNLQA